MKTSQTLYLLIISLFFQTQIYTQSINRDSIDRILRTIKEDTAKVNWLVRNSKKELSSSPEKGLYLSQVATSLSKKIHYEVGLAKASWLTGYYYMNIKNDPNKALRYYEISDSIYKLQKEKKYIEDLAKVRIAMGAIHQMLGNHLEAGQLYINASNIFDSLNEKKYLPEIYCNLSSLYSYSQENDKGEYYARMAIKTAEEINDEFYISKGCITLASILNAIGKYDEVIPNIERSKEIAEKLNNCELITHCYSVSGEYYGYTKMDYPKAIHSIQKAIENSTSCGDSYLIAKDGIYLCEFYFYNKQFKEAKESASKSYQLAHSLHYHLFEQYILNTLALSEASLGDYKMAYQHLLQYTELKDSIFKDDTQQQINKLETMYRTEKKEKDILQLQSEKQISDLILKRRKIMISGLFATLVLIVLLSFFVYRNNKTKRAIAEKNLEIEKQKTIALLKENQIVATHSVLQGEEAERSRLARDLHDGLGGLLSGLKLKLSDIKGNYYIEDEKSNDFNKAIDILDSSVTELRRVAHNMMPETLLNFGLKDALHDFCNQIDSTKQLKIKFQFFGDEARINNSLENTVYKIAMELINNSLKHAESSEIMVQLIQDDKKVSLTVQDNGKGFDPVAIENKKSFGLKNIRARVESFNGTIDLNSAPGKGTEILVEFSL